MDQSEECVICHRFDDQMLMLQCVHDPCINCAAAHYAEQFKGKLKNYYYTCQLCGQRTQLDISSVIELQKLAPKKFQESVSIKKPIYRDTIGDSTTSLPRKDIYEPVRDGARDNYKVQTEVYNTYKDVSRGNPKDNSHDNHRDNYGQDVYQDSRYTKKSSRACKEHADQQVSYYCFKCFENICPQCAIHGIHQGHDVKGIKKAIVDVRKQFSHIIESIGRTQEDLRKNKDQYSKRIRELSEETAKQKAFVCKQFQSLRNALMIKEREYLRQLDQINHRNGSILTTEIDLVNRQAEQSQRITRNIQQTLKRDEVSILQEYSKKSQSYHNEVEKMSVSQVGYGNVPGLKVANLSELKQIVSTVSGSIHDHGIRIQDLSYNI